MLLFSAPREVTVKVIVPDREGMRRTVEAGLGIDNYIHETGEVRGVIQTGNLERLRRLGYPVEILPDEDARRLAEEAKEPSGYPTHAQYVSFMVNTANTYPSIAKLDTFGYSVNGRPLLMMKISDNVTVDEGEPEFCFISTMHGDEPVGFVFLWWFIDSLTRRYATNTRIKRMVDSCEIYINPLLNPDGYVSMTRANANGADLNRDFPVPDGTYGDDTNYPVQTESNALITWARNRRISYTINFHGGALCVNYPWDYDVTRTTDDSLYKFISLYYSIKNTPMWNSATFPRGITNGYDWYEVNGSMQDWTYWLCGDLHVTVELGDTKTPTYSTLPSLWANNYEAFCSAVEVTLNHAVQGTITDSITGAPLAATVLINTNGKETYSSAVNGYYHRILLPGNYSITYSRPGYRSKTHTVTVPDTGRVTRNVQLVPRNLTYVYQSNLESNNGGLTTQSFGTNPQDWEYGASSVGIIPAYSGTRVWATKLSAQYSNQSKSRLRLTGISLPNVDSLTLSYWQWYSFQQVSSGLYHDGGNIKIRRTTGDSTIVSPTPGYDGTLSSSNVFLPGQQGYADTSLAKVWKEVVVNLNSWRGQTIEINWDFGSSSTNVQAGWFIDDISIYYPTANIIGIEIRKGGPTGPLYSTTSWAIGTIAPSTSVVMSTGDCAYIKNTGTVEIDLRLRALSSGWTLASTAGRDSIVIMGLFDLVTSPPVAADFVSPTDVLTTSYRTAGATNSEPFASTDANGVDITVGSGRYLFLLFRAPTINNLSAQQTITISVEAITSAR